MLAKHLTNQGLLGDTMGIDKTAKMEWMDCRVGLHFQQQHGGCTDEMEVTIIDSVEPGNHKLLDRKEEEWIHRLRNMDYMEQGGMNVRYDLKRNSRGQCKCKFCNG